MIDLYVRDHARWTTERKTEIARQWITEVKDHEKCRGTRITPKMVTEFLRAQEKNFEKALQRSKELKLSAPHSTRAAEVDLDLDFNGLVGKPRSAKVEVQRICPYYNQLYPALAGPMATAVSSTEPAISAHPQREISSARHPCPSPVLAKSPIHTIGFFEDFGDFNETSPHSHSSVATPGSCSIFDASSQASSRSTPTTVEEIQFTFQTIVHGFPPRPIPKSTCIVYTEPNTPAVSSALSSGVPSSPAYLESVKRAPIPAVEPAAIDAELYNEIMETNSLVMQLCELNLEPDPTQQQTSNVSITRKRKRTEEPTTLSHFDTVYTQTLRSGRKVKRARQDQRRLELELVISEAKETAKFQLAKFKRSEQPTLSLIQTTCRSPPISTQQTKHAASVIPVSDCPILDRQCSGLTASLQKVGKSLISNIESSNSPLTSLRKRRQFQEDIDEFCQNIGTITDLPAHSLGNIHALAVKTSRLCRIRRDLLVNYPAIKPLAYLQKRHRMEEEDPTIALRAWFYENISHPYPTKQQQEELSAETGLTVAAVRDWFRHARFKGNSSQTRANVRGVSDDVVAYELLPLLVDEDSREEGIEDIFNADGIVMGLDLPVMDYTQLLESEETLDIIN